eukprot:COSAG02_NODE_23135_length_729_cov_0.828571_1_plen_200_part_01
MNSETRTNAARTCTPVRALAQGSWVAVAGWPAGWPAAALRSCREVQSKYRINWLPHSKLTALVNDISCDNLAVCRVCRANPDSNVRGLTPSNTQNEQDRKVCSSPSVRYPRRAAPGPGTELMCSASQQALCCRSCLLSEAATDSQTWSRKFAAAGWRAYAIEPQTTFLCDQSSAQRTVASPCLALRAHWLLTVDVAPARA